MLSLRVVPLRIARFLSFFVLLWYRSFFCTMDPELQQLLLKEFCRAFDPRQFQGTPVLVVPRARAARGPRIDAVDEEDTTNDSAIARALAETPRDRVNLSAFVDPHPEHAARAAQNRWNAQQNRGIPADRRHPQQQAQSMVPFVQPVTPIGAVHAEKARQAWYPSFGGSYYENSPPSHPSRHLSTSRRQASSPSDRNGWKLDTGNGINFGV